MSEKIVGHLTINTEEKPIELDVLSGLLEQDTSLYDLEIDDFVSQKEYSLNIDVEDLTNEIYKDIEDITYLTGKFYKVKLEIDNKIEEGVASISQAMGISGLTLDLKITE